MIGRGKSGLLLPALLIAVGAGLAWIIYQEVQAPSDAVVAKAPATARQQPAVSLPSQPTFSLPPIRTFDAILKRPIFSPTRRATATAAIIVSQELGLILTGVSITTTEKFALLAAQEGGQSLRLREGEDYRGWTLARVDPHMVVFRREEQEEQLELIYDKPPQTQVKSRRNRRAKQQREVQKTKRKRKAARNPEDEEEEDEEKTQ